MHLFEYSGLTAEIPADIFDSIVSIERMRALDPIRLSEYRFAIPKAEQLMPRAAAESARYLFGANMAGYAQAMLGMLGADDRLFFDAGLPALHKVVTGEGCDIDDGAREALSQLSESFRMADEVDVNPLLLVPAATLDLINIAPFGESTVPTAMALMQGLLATRGFPSLRCISLESMMDKEDFEEAVVEGSIGWEDGASDPFPFVRCVCEAVLLCERRFDIAYPLDMGRKLDKSTRILNIIKSSREPVSKAEVCDIAPDISRRTADSVIAELVDAQLVEKVGSFKDARYASSGTGLRGSQRHSRSRERVRIGIKPLICQSFWKIRACVFIYGDNVRRTPNRLVRIGMHSRTRPR